MVDVVRTRRCKAARYEVGIGLPSCDSLHFFFANGGLSVGIALGRNLKRNFEVQIRRSDGGTRGVDREVEV